MKIQAAGAVHDNDLKYVADRVYKELLGLFNFYYYSNLAGNPQLFFVTVWLSSTKKFET